MDPTIKKQLKPTATTSSAAGHRKKQNPDPTVPSSASYLSKYFSKLNLNQKVRSSQKNTKAETPPPPPGIDTHLQGKTLAVSANFDSSKFSSVKSYQQPKKGNKLEDRKTTKEASKEKKTNRPSKDLDKKQLHVEQNVKKSTSVVKGANLSCSYDGLDIKKSSGVLVKATNLRSSYDGLDVKKSSGAVRVRELKNPLVGDNGRKISVPLEMRGGRRRSFCDSQVELAGILASNGVKVVSVDMPPFMQIHAVDCARKTCDSLEKFTSKAVASTLKKEFDGVYGPAWHCIVGKSFGSFVTHSVGGFLYFSIDQKLYILLFKTTVQRAEESG